ncbi:uncharacterized protein [Littorina saxatilis]|uniref:Sorting nexin-19 n=1 Tax=Littorina saxatilis TaxID=31220 RepID=A0AAN9ARH7_9CAEN
MRLELNSIVLLIIRDFVQFWYNKFSYNSQFLKDSRQCLFKGLHNIVDRMSRLGPQPTSAKVILAYREHLSTFQKAKSLMEHQEQTQKPPIKILPNVKLKKLESVDEAFHAKFKFHPALKSKDAEKRYLRSLTKMILLCSCSRDVVSAQSAQLFFIEILSVNLLLPVMEMLSTPDRLYEILIRLTYSDDDVMLNENTIKELIDLEVKRMQLQSAAVQTQPDTDSPVSQTIAKSLELQLQAGTHTEGWNQTDGEKGQSSQSSGPCDSQNSHVSFKPQSQPQQSCSLLEVKAGAEGDRKLTAIGDKNPPGLLTPEETSCKALTKMGSREDITESESKTQTVASDGKTGKSRDDVTRADKVMGDSKTGKSRDDVTQAETVISDAKFSVSGAFDSGETEKTTTSASSDTRSEKEKVQGVSELETVTEQSEVSEIGDSPVDGHSVSEQEQGVEEPAATGNAESAVAKEGKNHIYGEIVATNVPAVRPKLQAFKDLFKSKKSKQQEENKSDTSSDKIKSEANGRSFSDSILSSERLKSLRLSPLLGRSNKLSSSGKTDDSSAMGDRAATGKKQTDSDSERKSPSPLPTPSPSQPSKGGPLSFFKFRKPTLEFRKSSPPASDQAKTVDSSPADVSPEGAKSDRPATLIIPSVQVTDENGDGRNRNRSASGGSASSATSPSHLQILSISSYDEISQADMQGSPREKKRRMFFSFGEEEGEVEEAEEGEEVEREEGDDEGVLVIPPDSSLIFQDISVPSTMTCAEFRSNTPFTVYQIEYEALYFSETGNPVLKTGVAKRRYREFVILMSRLEDNPAYKKMLKDVKGPKRWLTLPFKNMDKENVADRQKALEQFLKSLIQVEAVCNGPEMREFLAYEGDSHIAFVKKATEINVPRIDKMLARTVSGVFDKLKSLPNLPGEVISGIRGRDAVTERKNSMESETDVDSVTIITHFAPDNSLENTLRDVSEKYTRDIQTQGHPDLIPSSPTSQLLKDMRSNLAQQILLHVPRVDGDGAEYPDDTEEAGGEFGVGQPGPGQLLLCDALIDLVVQLLIGQHHWLCHQRVITALRNVLGRTLDRWLREAVSGLTTEERCLYYIRLLRETVWPGGKFFSSQSEEKSPEEKAATRAVAKRLLVEFFPGVVSSVVGADSMEYAVEQVLESMQYDKLNKHFLYTAVDMLLENLFPEIADPQFQSRLIL